MSEASGIYFLKADGKYVGKVVKVMRREKGKVRRNHLILSFTDKKKDDIIITYTTNRSI